MKFDVVFSEEGLNTALTAVKLEKFRNTLEDPEVVRLLEKAEEELRKAVVRNEA